VVVRPPPALILVFLLVATSCFGAGSEDGGNDGERLTARRDPYFRNVACSLPHDFLVRTRNGYHRERSGDVAMVLKERYTFAYAHAGPYDYLQEVPLFFYGPGQVPAVGRVRSRAVMADVAPTMAAYLRFPFRAPDGRVLERAVLSAPRRLPRLVLVLVWDGAGRNVLSTWPDAWPTMRSLIPKGAWFENATINTSPSITPPVHATMGTGADPSRHGLISLDLRLQGQLVDSNRHPQYLLLPTLADLFDKARDNRPQIGLVAFRDWHMGMMGHGSYLDGADRDFAVLLDQQTGKWVLEGPNRDYYEFPSFVNEVPGLDESIRRLDLEDGMVDGRWRRVGITDPNALWRTPAYTEWQTAIIEEIVEREGFGTDDVPDLLFTNFKQVDEAAHWWSMNSRQVEATVRASDQALASLIELLDRTAGKNRWVVVVTADHGVVPNPRVSGGRLLRKEPFQADIRATFDGDGDDRDVLTKFRPTELWLDRGELRENGYTLAQVAEYLLRYTLGDNVAEPEGISSRQLKERVFAAAFPSRILTGLRCPG
jgi:arylsulfatase A-like enzyme